MKITALESLWAFYARVHRTTVAEYGGVSSKTDSQVLTSLTDPAMWTRVHVLRLNFLGRVLMQAPPLVFALLQALNGKGDWLEAIL